MTAFEQAWDVLKRYTPGWRSEARNLLDLSPLEVPVPYSDLEENQEHPLWLDEGSKVGVYEHPDDSEYVMKVPYADSHYDMDAFESRNENDEIMALLESLGYPIVGELDNWDRVDDATDAYSVQPRLHPLDSYGDSVKYYSARETGNVALHHLIRDRHWKNWGKDGSLGRVRNFDLDSIGATDDWWPTPTNDGIPPDTVGEWLQTGLDKHGIQHPVSRLLDEIPEVEGRLGVPDSVARRNNPLYQLQPFRRLLEEIEPHSENPKNLTVYGKPIWLEGFE